MWISAGGCSVRKSTPPNYEPAPHLADSPHKTHLPYLAHPPYLAHLALI